MTSFESIARGGFVDPLADRTRMRFGEAKKSRRMAIDKLIEILWADATSGSAGNKEPEQLRV
jgi:hypothetical protein